MKLIISEFFVVLIFGLSSGIPLALNPKYFSVYDSGSVQPKMWPFDSIGSDSVIYSGNSDSARVSWTTHALLGRVIPGLGSSGWLFNDGDETFLWSYPTIADVTDLIDSLANKLALHGKADSAKLADSAIDADTARIAKGFVHTVANGYIAHANSAGGLTDSCLYWGTTAYGTGPTLEFGNQYTSNPRYLIFNNSGSAGSRCRLSMENLQTAYGWYTGSLELQWSKISSGAYTGYSKFTIRTITDPSPETYIDHLTIMEQTGQLILNDALFWDPYIPSNPYRDTWYPVLINNAATADSTGLKINGKIKAIAKTSTSDSVLVQNPDSSFGMRSLSGLGLNQQLYKNSSNGFLIKTNIHYRETRDIVLNILGRNYNNSVNMVLSGLMPTTHAMTNSMFYGKGHLDSIKTQWGTDSLLTFWINTQESSAPEGNRSLKFYLFTDTTGKVITTVKDSTYPTHTFSYNSTVYGSSKTDSSEFSDLAALATLADTTKKNAAYTSYGGYGKEYKTYWAATPQSSCSGKWLQVATMILPYSGSYQRAELEAVIYCKSIAADYNNSILLRTHIDRTTGDLYDHSLVFEKRFTYSKSAANIPYDKALLVRTTHAIPETVFVYLRCSNNYTTSWVDIKHTSSSYVSVLQGELAYESALPTFVDTFGVNDSSYFYKVLADSCAHKVSQNDDTVFYPNGWGMVTTATLLYHIKDSSGTWISIGDSLKYVP